MSRSGRGRGLWRPRSDGVHHALDDEVGGELVCPHTGALAGVGHEDLAAADGAGEGGVAATPHLLVDVLLQTGLAEVVQAGQGLGIFEGLGAARAGQELVLQPLGSVLLPRCHGLYYLVSSSLRLALVFCLLLKGIVCK